MFSREAPDSRRKIARANAQTLGEDFRLDAAAAHALLRTLASHRLLEPEPDRAGDYRLTERFREIAAARVVRPLQRWQAKELLEAACRLVAQMNADSTRNSFIVETMAVSGDYMSRSDRIDELVLWPLVKPRHQEGARRIRFSLSETEGAKEIRTALPRAQPLHCRECRRRAASIDASLQRSLSGRRHCGVACGACGGILGMGHVASSAAHWALAIWQKRKSLPCPGLREGTRYREWDVAGEPEVRRSVGDSKDPSVRAQSAPRCSLSWMVQTPLRTRKVAAP